MTKPGHRPHPYTATIGMWLFLAALTMLFGATLLGYLLVRTRHTSPPLHSLRLPPLLFLSTAVILFGSVTIHLALKAVRRERQRELRRYLLLTCALAVLFLVVQTPAMASLLGAHGQMRQSQGAPIHLYGLVFVMILVHALHLLGGIVGLGVTTVHAFRGRYDHEHHSGVKHAAMYWHFLDVVWIVTFACLAIAG